MGGTIPGRADPSFILLAIRSMGSTDSKVQYDRMLVYGPDLAASSAISGYIYAGGDGWCSSPDPTTYNGRDQGRRAGEPVYLRTTADARAPMVSGSVRYRAATYALSGGPLPGVASGYTFAQPANIADIAGDWKLTDGAGNAFALTVGSSGSVFGSYRGCDLSGALQPDPTGVNQFALQFRVASGGCSSLQGHAGYPYQGPILAYPLAAGGWQMLMWAEWTDGWDWDGLLAVGRR
ncbi:MAG TPA: hypothetical protein VFA35_08870 [Burkholderiaceae bacterium]|nr:hypothetical protein [Burkholderiaceae bacterium]